MTTMTRLSNEQTYETFDIDAEFEELLRDAKPGSGFEITLDGRLTLPSAVRRLDSAARRLLHKRLRFAYSPDGKKLRVKVTDLNATEYRRSRRYTHVDRELPDAPDLLVTIDPEGIVTNVERQSQPDDIDRSPKRRRAQGNTARRAQGDPHRSPDNHVDAPGSDRVRQRRVKRNPRNAG